MLIVVVVIVVLSEGILISLAHLAVHQNFSVNYKLARRILRQKKRSKGERQQNMNIQTAFCVFLL